MSQIQTIHPLTDRHEALTNAWQAAAFSLELTRKG